MKPPRFSPLLLMLMFLSACSADRKSPDAEEGLTKVILVRHAEKQPGDTDPPITQSGRAWAEQLARFAAAERVRGVIATPARRTIQTATPTAEAMGVSVLIIPIQPGEQPIRDHAEAVVRLIETEPEIGVWLVVGHSNTVPAIIARLGGPPVAIGEADYGEVFVVGVGPEGFRGLRTRRLKVGG